MLKKQQRGKIYNRPWLWSLYNIFLLQDIKGIVKRASCFQGTLVTINETFLSY